MTTAMFTSTESVGGGTGALGDAFTGHLPKDKQAASGIIVGAIACIGGLAASAATAGVTGPVVAASCSNIVGSIFSGIIKNFETEVSAIAWLLSCTVSLT